MDVPTLGKLKPFTTIGAAEKRNVLDALKRPLSGYLGGVTRGGYWVERLAEEWCEAFDCKYAIPCNSATSGLLAACMAAGIGPGDEVWVPTYTMSATATCAMVLGANVVFRDIEPRFFCLNLSQLNNRPKAIIVTNLFGHPAELRRLRKWCDRHKVFMIEDNAQAIGAGEDGIASGTVGHVGVFSLNVHKHINCGEGGIVVCQDQGLADDIHCRINHGELSVNPRLGLNLRLSEPSAAIACAQLEKLNRIIVERRKLAQMLSTYAISKWLVPPETRRGCGHVYYIWAAKTTDAKRRKKYVRFLNDHNFPIRAGYSPPLHRIFKRGGSFPVADTLEDEGLITFEVCAYDPTPFQMKQMREIMLRAGDHIR